MAGYKDPPKEYQFKKGQIANPRGRPKGRVKLMTDLAAELAETIQVMEGGKPKRITKQRALLKALTAGGIKGNARAAAILLGMIARLLENEPELATNEEMSANDRRILETYIERAAASRSASSKQGEA